MQKLCIAIFPLNSLQNQQQKNGSCRNSAFQLRNLDAKILQSHFPLNSLKNQQQIDNAEILHFNFEKYKIWMQKFRRASFCQIHYKNNITNLASKCAGGINEQLLKRQVLMFYRPGKNSKNLRGGQLPSPPPAPLLYAQGLNSNSPL